MRSDRAFTPMSLKWILHDVRVGGCLNPSEDRAGEVDATWNAGVAKDKSPATYSQRDKLLSTTVYGFMQVERTNILEP